MSMNCDTVQQMACFPPFPARYNAILRLKLKQAPTLRRVKSLTEMLMKQGLPRRPLRCATSEAYDPSLKRARNSVVERLAEEYALDGPIAGVHSHGTTMAETLSDSVASKSVGLQREGLEAIVANPLREDVPHPTVITTVKRFGVVGLTACALCAALLRWWRSLTS